MNCIDHQIGQHAPELYGPRGEIPTIDGSTLDWVPSLSLGFRSPCLLVDGVAVRPLSLVVYAAGEWP
jgi:hypothetical protein